MFDKEAFSFRVSLFIINIEFTTNKLNNFDGILNYDIANEFSVILILFYDIEESAYYGSIAHMEFPTLQT